MTSIARSSAAPVSPAIAARLASLNRLVAAPPHRAQRESYAPFDGSSLGRVPDCTPDDVAEAVRRARGAQPEWAARPAARRASVLRRYHRMVLDRQSDLLDVIQAETGKSRIGAFEEVTDVAMTALYYAKTAAEHLKPVRRRGAFPLLTHTVEHHVPKGVVGVVAPWNYPFVLGIGDALAALAAGNAVVLKPDAQTPFTALTAAALLHECGLPRGVLQLVTGEGSVLGEPLIDAVDYLMFTGSTATGRIVARQCAERLIGCSAELGGKNPMIVLEGADVRRAVEGAVRACFASTGQLCISIERMYVADAIYDGFVPAFADRVRRISLGAGFDWSTEVGSLTSRRQLDTVVRHVDDAVAKGARVLAGGRARPDLGPLFYQPTVLENVPDTAELARAETFGPVVAVYRVAGPLEAVEAANDSCYGLNASVWGPPARAADVARLLRAGTVNVNEGYAAGWASHDAPMGGMKDSGLGRRHGREGILKYTEAQTIAVQRGLPVGPLVGVPHRLYARAMTAAVRSAALLPAPRRK